MTNQDAAAHQQAEDARNASRAAAREQREQVAHDEATDGSSAAGEAAAGSCATDKPGQQEDSSAKGEPGPQDEEETGPPMCWICYDGNLEDMVAPCLCKGSLKWAHARCLAQWINANLDRSRLDASCPQCKEEYRIKKLPQRAAGATGGASPVPTPLSQPWPSTSLLPRLGVLRELDESLAADVQARLQLLGAALLPHILSVLVPLLYVGLHVAADADARSPRLTIGAFAGEQRPQTVVTWLEAHLGARFAPPADLQPPAITVAWSATYVQLQSTCTIAIVMVFLLLEFGYYEWVVWEEDMPALAVPGLSACVRWLARTYWGQLALLLNVPFLRMVRGLVAVWGTLLVRPWRAAHDFIWWLCYEVFTSKMEVFCTTSISVLVLGLWLYVAHKELMRCRQHVVRATRFLVIGDITIANRDDASAVVASAHMQ